MNKKIVLIVIFLLGLCAIFFGLGGRGPNISTEIVSTNDNIRLTTPLANSIIKSPLTIRGEARGNWYFEASFPVKLYDANGKELLATPVMARGDWMTTDFVPFEAVLTFSTPTTDTGTLVLEKDNPSGLAEHADSITIPVRFK
jgi:hypothetical protein